MQMAHMHEKIEYLLEARKAYGDSAPPFAQRGIAGAQRPIHVRLLDGTREARPVRFRTYKSPLDDLFYATVRLDGHAYIIKRLPREWKLGNSTRSHTEDRSWFVWQGTTHHFRGRQFDGPVARSVGAYPGKIRPVTTIPGGTQSSVPGDSSEVLADRTDTLGESHPLRLAQLQPGFANPHTRAEDQKLADTSMEALMTEIKDASEHGYGPGLASRPPVLDKHSKPNLIREEMDGITLGLSRGNTTDFGYIPMRLGEAKPRDGSPLTLESLFEKITKVFRIKDKEFFILRRAFVKGPVNSEPHQPNPEPTRELWIGREAEQSWVDFLSDLRDQIREHGVQGWHVRLHAYSA